jgi:hypothetical protein
MNQADEPQDNEAEPAVIGGRTVSTDGFRLRGDLPQVVRLSRKTLASIKITDTSLFFPYNI